MKIPLRAVVGVLTGAGFVLLINGSAGLPPVRLLLVWAGTVCLFTVILIVAWPRR